jgi:hypothetical protein
MRAARWLLGSAAVSSLAIALAAGCGGGTNGVAPIEEAGPDVVEDVTMHDSASEAATDAKADVTDAKEDVKDAVVEAACPVDGTVQTFPVPDASLNDSGATAAGCEHCLITQSACSGVITACNASCTCLEAFQQFDLCLGEPGQTLQMCGETLAMTSGLSLSQLESFEGCALSCALPCGLNTTTAGDGGKEGSTTEGGSSEASTGEAGTTSDAAGE